jgi:hemerythrin-like domain-containing protein
MPSFNHLLELHQRLDDLFLEHQRALLRLDLDRATTALEDYAMELLAHIRDEETLMIPLYRERAKAPLGGAVEIFLGEHEKLKRFLVLFAEEIEKIRAMDDVERGVLFLIDSQHLFKRLLVHHDTRERKMLYPLLDELTNEDERENLFAQFVLTPGVTVAAVR